MFPCRSSPVGAVKMNPLALAMEDPHVYEDINKVLGRLPPVPVGLTEEEEVITTTCPAYTSITRQPQLDAVYDVVQESAPNLPECDVLANADDTNAEYENL